MNTRLMVIGGALISSLLSMPAFAQPGPGTGGMGGMAQTASPGARPPRDCSNAPNPANCQARREARREAMTACQQKSGPEHRQCVQQKMPPVDCSKAVDPQRCALHQKAREACKEKIGPDHKNCLREQFNVR